jgi:hypothetical protein
VGVAEGQHSKQKSGVASSSAPSRGTPSQPVPFRIEHLILLGATGTEPVDINAMTFGDDGIGVIRYAGELPRVLPWTSVAAHAVEPWQGGEIPEWWVDPELNRDDAGAVPGLVTDPSATSRARLQAESGALIVVQTATGVYRFILPGGDPRDLSGRVTAFAVRHQGPSAASSVTRVVAWGQDAERRKSRRPPQKPSRWLRLRPYLAVLLILFVAAVIALILLQSAGTVHLPYLGGSNSTSGMRVVHGVGALRWVVRGVGTISPA